MGKEIDFEQEASALLVLWNAREMTGDDVCNQLWDKSKKAKERWRGYIKSRVSKNPLERLFV